jgi:hypothetical protein
VSLGIGDIIKPIQDALTPIGNTLGDAWQFVLGDRFAAWRLTNAAKIQVKVNEQVQALGLKLNTAKIPERYALAWFEEATKQDEDEIQTLFAKLLTKASNGDEDALDRRLIGILGQLTPYDAKAFKALCEFQPTWDESTEQKELREKLLWKRWTEKYAGHIFDSASHERRTRCIEHLFNIGLIDKEISIAPDRFRSTYRVDSRGGIPDMKYEAIIEFKLTALGASLYIATR